MARLLALNSTGSVTSVNTATAANRISPTSEIVNPSPDPINMANDKNDWPQPTANLHARNDRAAQGERGVVGAVLQRVASFMGGHADRGQAVALIHLPTQAQRSRPRVIVVGQEAARLFNVHVPQSVRVENTPRHLRAGPRRALPTLANTCGT